MVLYFKKSRTRNISHAQTLFFNPKYTNTHNPWGAHTHLGGIVCGAHRCCDLRVFVFFCVNVFVALVKLFVFCHNYYSNTLVATISKQQITLAKTKTPSPLRHQYHHVHLTTTFFTPPPAPAPAPHIHHHSPFTPCPPLHLHHCKDP